MNLKTAILLCAVGSLPAIGLVTLVSTMVDGGDPNRLRTHAWALALGGGLGLAAALIDYRRLSRHGLPRMLLGLSLAALALVLVPGIGEEINGARRWFRWGGQPSEFAKVAVLVWLANYAACHMNRMGDSKAGFVTPLLGSGAASLLIFVEQDWGTALLLVGASVSMLTVAGTRPVYLGGAGLGGLGLLTILVRQDPHRLARLICFLDPERYQDGIGAQQWHGLLSMGSGGLFGGFFGSGRHKFGFVPEQHTDFIFSLIGEELGLSGTLLVLGLFFLVFKSGLSIAWGAGDPFGRFLAVGLTSLMTCQALVNMGVVTCLLPNKGIPLPFISYGASDLLCMCVATGLLVSIATHSPKPPAGQKPPPSPEDDAARDRRAALHALPLGDEKRPWWKRIRLRLGRVGTRNAFRVSRIYQRPLRAIAVRPTEGARPSESGGSWEALKFND